MTVGSDLRADHRVIRRLEATLRDMAAMIAEGEVVPPKDVEEGIKLMAEFVDLYHHAKEEAGLFPVIQGTSREQQKVVYGFLVEHEFGRRVAQRIEQEYVIWARRRGSSEPLSRFLLTYAEFLKTHTRKEDEWFEVVDRKLLSAEQQKDVLARFAQLGKRHPLRKAFSHRIGLLAERYVG